MTRRRARRCLHAAALATAAAALLVAAVAAPAAAQAADPTLEGVIERLQNLIAGLLALGGVLLMTHETLHTRYELKEVAPRLVVGAVAANLSLLPVGYGIDTNPTTPSPPRSASCAP